MKLRIDPARISFRLDFSELNRLLEEGNLSDFTPLSEGQLSYKVIALPDGSDAIFTCSELEFCLSLPRDIVQAHKAALPSLKGIVTRFPTRHGREIDVSLEVNLKKKLKHDLER